MKILKIFLILSIIIFSSFPVFAIKEEKYYKQHVEQNIYLDNPDPSDYLTFEDLVKLSKEAKPKGQLKSKLENHLSMVYLVNRTEKATLERPYIRVAQWNIKRGFNVNEIISIVTNPNDYKSKYLRNIKGKTQKVFNEELKTFSSADIFCFNEVDIGMPRTGYKNIASTISDSLGWNYAYASEFIEVGPIFQKEKINELQYRGLHGNVIISRFPIISAKVIRLPNFYDWYKEEVKIKQSPLEHFRKFGAKAIFRERILHHEVRHGGRSAIIADIKLPNEKTITVVLTHLEDRAYSDERLKQFKYILSNIKDKKSPVILTGDFNTSTTDTKPTSAKKEVNKRVRDPHYLLRQAAFIPVPFVPVVGGIAAVTFSKLLQYKDPIFPSIPVLFPNHERKFFNYLKKFRFADGNGFDLNGDRKQSSNGKAGLLANSNQRHWKGFKSTYKLEEPRIIAYFKLDWFFIKPTGNHFKPFNGRTMRTLNRSYKGGISDHNPITVDISL